jgi:hypothetical protein
MIVIDETRLRHIFRNAEGHLTADTPENRQVLLIVAHNLENFLGVDRFGNTWAAHTNREGRQAWLQIRDNRITNGGINTDARAFSSATGLAIDLRPGAP